MRKEKVGYFKTNKYKFIFLREISSFIISLYAIYFLFKLYLVFNGEETYNAYYSSLTFLFSGPIHLIISIIALIFALIHTLTWFSVLSWILKKPTEKYPSEEFKKKSFRNFLIIAITWLLISLGIYYLIY